MVIDTGDLGNFTNSGGNYRFFRNVIMHEHGHGLGLAGRRGQSERREQPGDETNTAHEK